MVGGSLSLRNLKLGFYFTWISSIQCKTDEGPVLGNLLSYQSLYEKRLKNTGM
jgi:hypothetical protein